MKEKEISRYWKKIINTMNDGLMLIGKDGKILMVNRAFEQLTGYSKNEIIGNPCTILNCDVCERILEKEEGVWCTLFKHGKDVKKRCVVMKKDGTYMPALKNATLLRDDSGGFLGAVETLADISELDRLDHEIDMLSLQLEANGGFHGIIGKSKIMQNVFQVITKAAQSDAPVVVYGESGTGKELVARAIHILGKRKDGPYIQLNCAALNETLLESELFGHVKGAFTGAYRHRLGRFEAAHTGDLFLDEIGDMPLSIQAKLLRVLESKQFEHVGDNRPIYVDVRIITGTNKNLEELIAQKVFRDDLFFRINVIPIHLPPLRERLEDIPPIVNTFIKRLQSNSGKKITGLTPTAMDCFMSYHWPGNVRELKSALEYAFVIAERGLIDAEQLPHQIVERKKVKQTTSFLSASSDQTEKASLIEALRQTKGNQSKAAKILGVNRMTVWNRMRKYQIDLKKEIVS